MVMRIAVFVLIMAAFSMEMHAASFDCAKAKSRAEIVICSDSELSAIDDELAKLYAKAKSLASSPAEFKTQGEREWKRRETTCFDKPCLLAWYAQRRQQLLNIINAQKAQQPSPAPAVKDSAVIAPRPTTVAEEKATAPSSSSSPPNYQIRGTGYYGCSDRENFKKLRDLLIREDDAAFLKELTASVNKGECIMWKKGEKVFLEEGTVLSTVIRIRKEGDANAHWTTPKAILP